MQSPIQELLQAEREPFHFTGLVRQCSLCRRTQPLDQFVNGTAKRTATTRSAGSATRSASTSRWCQPRPAGASPWCRGREVPGELGPAEVHRLWIAPAVALSPGLGEAWRPADPHLGVRTLRDERDHQQGRAKTGWDALQE